MIKIALAQMNSGSNVEKNLQTALDFIEQAAKRHAKMIFFPEEFLTLGLTNKQRAPLAEFRGQGPWQDALSSAAKANNIWVLAGTMALRQKDKDRIYASTLLFNNEGECVAHYDKLHLFDNVVGKEKYRESKAFAPGDRIVVVDTPLGKMGFAICYDLRFPELFRALCSQGAECLVLPSAFIKLTGKAHWEVLIRARAIENLALFIAPDQVGTRANGYGTYGHSMVVSPWGEILLEGQATEGLLYCNVDPNISKQWREKFPALSHRREDFF